MRYVSDLIDALGGSGKVASAINKPLGTVASWRHRQMIPVEEWQGFISLAASQEVEGVSADLLLNLHAPGRAQPSPQAERVA